MAGSFQLIVVTPQRKLLSEPVERIAVRGSEGEMGILYDHSPMVTQLGRGTMRAVTGKDSRPIAISGGGYMEVLPDRVTILADMAEFPEEIDVARARQAKERAEKRLAGRPIEENEEVNYTRAQTALKRALTRLEAAKWAK